MSSALGAIGLFLGIAVLIFLGWKGVHTVVSAIAAALVVIVFNWMNFWDTFNNSFMSGAAAGTPSTSTRPCRTSSLTSRREATPLLAMILSSRSIAALLFIHRYSIAYFQPRWNR